MSFGETIFLAVLALVVFGPKKLPEIARTVGKYLAEFRRASNEFKSQIEQEIAHLEVQERAKERQKAIDSAIAPGGTASRDSTPAAAAAKNESGSDPAPAATLAAATPASETASSSPAATTESAASAETLSSSSPVTETVPAPASQESHA